MTRREIQSNKTNWLILFLLLAVSLIGLEQPASAQKNAASQKPTGDIRTDTEILYHGGPVLMGTPGVYVVWYGCWDNNCAFDGDPATKLILESFLENLGGTPYFQINAGYPGGNGFAPSGAFLYGRGVFDRYSHGVALTAADIESIVTNQIVANGLPQDPQGIYLVFASQDVSSLATGFCKPSTQPHHGRGEAFGSSFTYGFVGNPVRCPKQAAPQFVGADGHLLPTPNGSLAADGMASTIASLLDAIVTNPFGSGWFDMYGLENADKCAGTFGQTYLTVNGARANLNLAGRDYLIQQNWVNDQPGRCAMLSGGP